MVSECPTCEDTFDTSHGMKIHHARQHGKSLNYKNCKQCGKEFKEDTSGTRDFCSHECYSKNRKGKFAGKDAPRHGVSGEEHPTWVEREERDCPVCGNVFVCKATSDRKTCSQKCGWILSEENTDWNSGEQHPSWKEGSTGRFGDNWQEMREKVMERDKSCQRCGDEEVVLDAHHITPRRLYDKVEDSNTMDNLIALCRSCHMKVEHGSAECPEVSQ